MDPVDLACNELVEIVTDYLEGALPPEERARFEQHLAECPGCEAYLDQMRLAITMTGALRVEDLPSDVLDDLVGAFRSWRDGERR
jgi:anti-sigma factor RsiW